MVRGEVKVDMYVQSYYLFDTHRIGGYLNTIVGHDHCTGLLLSVNLFVNPVVDSDYRIDDGIDPVHPDEGFDSLDLDEHEYDLTELPVEPRGVELERPYSCSCQTSSDT